MRYADYFTEHSIIDLLCRYRVHLASRRHERELARRLTRHGGVDHEQEELDLLLPPRQLWSRYRPQERQELRNVDFATLRYATITLHGANPGSPRVRNLNALIARVQSRALGITTFEFAQPTVRWMEKGNNKYRAITEFNLEDSVICSLVARYITDYVDSVLEDSSFAFRSRRAEGGTPTYHSAFDRLWQVRTNAAGGPLWVAECDIQGFFDCLDHDVAIDALHRAIHARGNCNGEEFAPEAHRIYRAYLTRYNYPTNILREASPRLRAARGANAHFGWPSAALQKYHVDPHSVAIGVPQGGALSGLMANLVLDFADKRIKQLQQRCSGLRYLRYCDDMVLIAPDRRVCEKAFAAYLTILDELKLPYHPPVRTVQYDKSFWGNKSKAPYCWAPKTKPHHVPWVQFVGYQVRYDGLVRVKPASVKKQKTALMETVGEANFLLERETLRQMACANNLPRIAITRSAAVTLVVRKLICKGVGRVDPFVPATGPMPMCWTAGFKAVHNKPFVPTFLKQLDRERERQIRRFKRKQFNYRLPNPNRRNFMFEPWGYRHSYHAQFNNEGGMDLIRNPFKNISLKMRLQIRIGRCWAWTRRFIQQRLHFRCEKK